MTHKQIEKRIAALTAARDAAQDAADMIEDGEQWEAADRAINAEYQPQIDNLYKWACALNYPQPRQEWFCTVFAPSFATGQHRISYKQQQIFDRYTDKPRYNMLSGCVVGNRLYQTVGNRLYIEELPTI